MAWSELLGIRDFATGRRAGLRGLGGVGEGRLLFVVDDDMMCECWSGGVEEVTNCFCVCSLVRETEREREREREIKDKFGKIRKLIKLLT